MTLPSGRGRIAFIDDEPDLCIAAGDWLEGSGFEVRCWSDPALALAEIDTDHCDAVITDLRMPGLNGQQLLARLRQRAPDLPVVLMSAHADVPAAVAVMREGAHDFVEKPCMAEHLVLVLDRAVEWRRMTQQMRDLRQSPGGDPLARRLIGHSPRIQQLRDGIRSLADAPVDVLIEGRIGTGREQVARLIHELSRRARRQFVALDCSAIPEDRLEAELFGHDRGAIPGTSGERHGRLEFTSGGTLYLSEVHALSPGLQSRLFRVLHDRQVTRLGGSAARPVDVRLIASTPHDPRQLIRDGRLRQDLGFRLMAAGLQVPGLEERPEDIPLLHAHCLHEAARRFRRPEPRPAPAEIEALKTRAWPGQLAQLQALAERQVLGLQDMTQTEAHAQGLPDSHLPLARRVALFEAAAIREALERCGGSSAVAAEHLGLPRRTLNEKIARYGLRQRD